MQNGIKFHVEHFRLSALAEISYKITFGREVLAREWVKSETEKCQNGR